MIWIIWMWRTENNCSLCFDLQEKDRWIHQFFMPKIVISFNFFKYNAQCNTKIWSNYFIHRYSLQTKSHQNGWNSRIRWSVKLDFKSSTIIVFIAARWKHIVEHLQIFKFVWNQLIDDISQIIRYYPVRSTFKMSGELTTQLKIKKSYIQYNSI